MRRSSPRSTTRAPSTLSAPFKQGRQLALSRTITRRGAAIAVRKEGWHTGNGRTTWCGQTRDQWDLGFRSGGGASRCADCEERDIYPRETRPDPLGTVAVTTDPLHSRGVLRDADVADGSLVPLLRRAPECFDVRRARSALERPNDDELDPFCAAYKDAVQVLGTKRPVDRWCGLSLVVSPNLATGTGWLTVDEPAAEA